MKASLTTLFVAILLLLIAVALFAVKQIIFNRGPFRPGHAHDLPRLRRRALELKNKQKNNT